MAVPKNRVSRSKKRTRRANKKMGPVTVSECPHCHEPKLPHRVCLACGYYKGQQVVKISEED